MMDLPSVHVSLALDERKIDLQSVNVMARLKTETYA